MPISDAHLTPVRFPCCGRHQERKSKQTPKKVKGLVPPAARRGEHLAGSLTVEPLISLPTTKFSSGGGDAAKSQIKLTAREADEARS